MQALADPVCGFGQIEQTGLLEKQNGIGVA
jgi:hypothetical protein